MSKTITGVTALLRRALPVVKLGARRIAKQKSPFQMTLSLTNRCNFRCSYCHIPLEHRDEMSTGEWKQAIDELAAGGMGRASLMGGEPMLRKDVGEIAAHLRARGVHTSINTNAWFIPSRIDEIASVDLVCITLDGPESVHDAQRHPGSYARVLEAMDVLRARGIPMVTMTVVTPSARETVDHVLDVARRYGFLAFFQIEHEAGFDVALPIAKGLSDTAIRALAERLLDRKRRGEPVGNSVAALEAQRDRRVLVACSDCHAGTYYGYVLSDGTVAPCLFTQGQAPRKNGLQKGFLRAFNELDPPVGAGCSCVPTHEVNRMLDLDPGVIFDAMAIALS